MLGWEDCADRTEQDFAKEIGWSDYKQQPNDPASRPIEAADELKIGQEVLFCNQLVWKSGKVADLSPTDVVVEFVSFSGRNESKFVPRLAFGSSSSRKTKFECSRYVDGDESRELVLTADQTA